ncbi:cytochrome P450 3A8-like [Limulus polyphemus]|uniref:Cytochrome P450 3A8-like n=1 Tax=Limulus polyphemus TaxID=6850 RepID=A0ABM1T862_LIMPO|nr:cytochrome P450 3A8-like [Limulus polyphemus]
MIWSISFAIFLGLIALWIRWRVKMTSVFSNLGVPGPTPSLLFGNLIELYKKGPLRCHDDWIKEYGKVVGFYEGMKPVLLIAEPELLKSVLMKDFHNFTDRPEVIPLKGKKEDIFSKELINLKGQRWKEVRSILTPTFSTAKLKQMTSIISHTVDIFISKVKKKSECGEFFDIYDLYQRLTTDVIERTALGMDTGVQEKDHDPLLQSAQLIFRMKFADPLSFIGLCFPGLRPLAFFLMVIFIRVKNEGYLPGWRIIEGCEKIINERRADSTKRVPDLLQLMLDAEVSRNDLQNITNDKLTAGNDDVTSDKKSPDHAVDDEQRKKRSRYMTDDEIKANALIVFLAGYETTSSALAYTTYLLAKHPEVQNQVREELDNHMNDEVSLNCFK